LPARLYFHLRATSRKKLTSCRMAKKKKQVIWKLRIVYNIVAFISTVRGQE